MGDADFDVGNVTSNLHLRDVNLLVLDANIVLQLGEAQSVKSLVAKVAHEFAQRFEVVELPLGDRYADVCQQALLKEMQTLIQGHFKVYICRRTSLEMSILDKGLIEVLKD